MKRFNFEKYKKGIMTVQIKTFTPEKFINILWKNGISVKNVEKKDISTLCFDIKLKDYGKINTIAKKTNAQIKVLNRKGISFFIIKTQNRMAFILGILIFVGIIYYLSTFIWNINITTENNVTPFEIREELNKVGITPGTRKRKIDVYDIEDKIIRSNANIMWVRARIEGSKLNINLAERQEPPKVDDDNSPCNIIAKKDGEVVRIYSTAGTAVVSCGDVVKKGDVLVKGEQGNEENIYQVHANAEVVARTFYESKKQVPLNFIDKKRTGNQDKDVYIKTFGKRVYLKKSKNKFKTCDKISIHKGMLNEDVFYEVKEKQIQRSKEEAQEKTSKELFSNIIVKLDKSVKIVDKIIETKLEGDKYEVRVVLVVEENIADTQVVEEIPQEDTKDKLNENDKDKLQQNNKEKVKENNKEKLKENTKKS